MNILDLKRRVAHSQLRYFSDEAYLSFRGFPIVMLVCILLLFFSRCFIFALVNVFCLFPQFITRRMNACLSLTNSSLNFLISFMDILIFDLERSTSIYQHKKRRMLLRRKRKSNRQKAKMYAESLFYQWYVKAPFDCL